MASAVAERARKLAETAARALLEDRAFEERKKSDLARVVQLRVYVKHLECELGLLALRVEDEARHA